MCAMHNGAVQVCQAHASSSMLMSCEQAAGARGAVQQILGGRHTPSSCSIWGGLLGFSPVLDGGHLADVIADLIDWKENRDMVRSCVRPEVASMWRVLWGL